MRNLEKHQIELKLSLGRPWKQRVFFNFDYQIFLFAYSLYKCSPEEFQKLDIDVQFTALAYGGYKSGLNIKKRFPKVSYKALCYGLLKASKSDNRRLAEALESMKIPDWLKGTNMVQTKK